MAMTILDDRAVIAIAGDTARAFLQGLITNDMNDCTPGHPIYAALLTPQGKILFDFIVLISPLVRWASAGSLLRRRPKAIAPN